MRRRYRIDYLFKIHTTNEPYGKETFQILNRPNDRVPELSRIEFLEKSQLYEGSIGANYSLCEQFFKYVGKNGSTSINFET